MTEQETELENRRLSDKILDAFDMACDQKDTEVADGLYKTLELVLTRIGGATVIDRRSNIAFIHEAAARLQKLRGDNRYV
jgi:hypothetical protein